MHTERKVLIAIPSTGYVPAQTVTSLLELITVPGTKHSILVGSLVYDAREKLAKSAIEEGYTHILWLDSDITFPRDTLLRLLDCDADIASGVVYRRVAPYTPTVFTHQPNGLYAEMINIPDRGIIRVDGCGFACVLTKTECLSAMYQKFDRLFVPEAYGEDLQFCNRAAKCGYKITVDCSLKCGHLGQILIGERQFKTAREELYRMMREQ